jgi:hypothetical protein
MTDIIEILLKIKDKNDLYLSILNELVDSSMSLNCHLYKKGIPLAISDTIEKYQEVHNIITHDKMIHKLKELNQKINNDLFEYCEHVYTIDYIDIHPDKMKQIYYCSKCLCTFKGLRI